MLMGMADRLTTGIWKTDASLQSSRYSRFKSVILSKSAVFFLLLFLISNVTLLTSVTSFSLSLYS